jgi:hypothetical protein
MGNILYTRLWILTCFIKCLRKSWIWILFNRSVVLCIQLTRKNALWAIRKVQTETYACSLTCHLTVVIKSLPLYDTHSDAIPWPQLQQQLLAAAVNKHTRFFEQLTLKARQHQCFENGYRQATGINNCSRIASHRKSTETRKRANSGRFHLYGPTSPTIDVQETSWVLSGFFSLNLHVFVPSFKILHSSSR